MKERELCRLPDEAVVELAQAGSGPAYEYLIQKYKALAREKAKIYFITGADRDDVIQEGMIGIFKAVRDFDRSACVSFHTFAELCITRQILSAIRGANRQKHQILNESVSLQADPAGEPGALPLWEQVADDHGDWDPESLTLMKEIAADLKADGQNLFSPLERQVWEALLRGQNYREIARTLRRSTKTVDNAMQRIRRKVALYLER